MRYGYARISTDDQNLDRQRVALDREACHEVIEETQSGVRPGTAWTPSLLA